MIASLAAGMTVLDSSIGGTGGCVYGAEATGNVATEDLVYRCDRGGVLTGIDLELVLVTTAWLEDRLGKPHPGAILRAGSLSHDTT